MPKPSYSETKSYTVKLRKIVRHGPIRFLPGGIYEMTGAFLNKLVDEHGENCVDTAVAIS